MRAVGRAMSTGEGAGAKAAGADVPGLIREHAAVMARVAMALLGDRASAERALEHAAHEAGATSRPEGVSALAWLVGLVRAASAVHLAKLPLRTRTGPLDAAAPVDAAPPVTERLGAGGPVRARDVLARLKPTEREAVVLCLVGGLEAADVAAACNVNVGTARARIARGVEQLLAATTDEEGGAR